MAADKELEAVPRENALFSDPSTKENAEFDSSLEGALWVKVSVLVALDESVLAAGLVAAVDV